MHLRLGSRRYDLSTRALVLGVAGAGEEGADLVERAGAGAGLPMCVAVTDEAGVGRALSAGASLLRMAEPTSAGLARCASAGAAVVVPAGARDRATAAGLPPDRIVPDSLLLDVTRAARPTAAAPARGLPGAPVVRPPARPDRAGQSAARRHRSRLSDGGDRSRRSPGSPDRAHRRRPWRPAHLRRPRRGAGSGLMSSLPAYLVRGDQPALLADAVKH